MFNLQSQRGVPISTISNSPPGSDGRMSTTNESFGSFNLPTTNQFGALISFGGIPGLTSNQWIAISNSVILRTGTTPFSADVAVAMQLPVGREDNSQVGRVVVVLRRAQVGAPYLSRQISFLFGSEIAAPETDERGLLLTNVVNTAYWLGEPYSTNKHTNAPYYWSPHAQKVYAVQPGTLQITWRKAAPYTAATLPAGYTNAAGAVSFDTNGASIYLLYTATYLVSGSAVKPPRKIYWTEGQFRITGKPIDVPSARVGNVHIVYHSTFPPRVTSNEVIWAQGQEPFVPDVTDRTLWYDTTQSKILARNREGRVFLELLGAPRGDGENRHQLGYEIVDVYREPIAFDVTTELGEQLTPPPPGSVLNLFPEPIDQGEEPFAFSHNEQGSARVQLYALRETSNLNDYLVHWMEEGLQGLRWPAVFARYRFMWPTDATKYSHYVRPLVDREAEAMQTAIALPADNVPVIEYQDSFNAPPKRAKLTDDFKFYTFLEADFPAHRTLLRFTAGDNVAFERVFSWLDVNLKTTNFTTSPIATSLDSWNPTNNSFTWLDELRAPRVIHHTVEVGQRIAAPFGESASLAGHINHRAGTLFNVNAYLDPFAAGFELANQGAIIPINAIPGTNNLEVWWFRTNTAAAGPNAANAAKGFKNIFWPSVIGRYTIEWPASPREIVLASNDGGGPPLDGLEAEGTIYFQNDPALPGYNPNEEHAIMSGGTAYATRDDLNITNDVRYSSRPFVLVDYEAADGRPAMIVFRVLREKPEASLLFDYIVEAGRLLQPPMPLPLLARPLEITPETTINYNTEPDRVAGDFPGAWDATRDANGPYAHYPKFTYRDRQEGFWVYRGLHSGLPGLQAGTYVATNNTFVAVSNAIAVAGQSLTLNIHVSRQGDFLALIAPAGLPEWLTTSGLTLQGTPATNHLGTNTLQLVVEDLYDHSRVTNNIVLAVRTSGTVVGQGALTISSTNTYTGAVTVFSNRPPFLAGSPTSSNSFTMRFYYKTEASFAFPGAATAPAPGSIVPYLRRFDAATTNFVGDGASKTTESLDIVYRPVWPVRDPKDSSKALPSLPFGATLTTPRFGLPAVRDMKTAQVLYQQSIATNIANAYVSAVLHDATRAKFSDLRTNGLTKLPSGVKRDSYQGNFFFPDLPPHLAGRLFYEPNRGISGSLVLKGEFKDELFGEKYILLNVLRGSDLAAAEALCPSADPDYSKWTSAIDALATSVETFHESPVHSGIYVANSNVTVRVGVQDLAVVSNANVAVDSYALSATGPGSGYVTLLESSGTAFTEPGDPVAMHIFKVGGELHVGELKVIAAANPLSELLTLQHTADLAGRSADFEYEWKIGAPVDGLPPTVDDSMSRYQSLTSGSDVPRYTLGGADIRVLADNYIVMRYRPANTNHPLYNLWSAWTTPQLAEGWIKRVLAGINPFNQRINDLFNNRVNTDISILTQAGRRWEGDVALNLETINNFGLIEIYETILRRGRMLSIESGYNYGPANDALLLAAGYLNDLYMMIGNEAWADAANPTIGIGTKDQTYADIATALFAFRGQVRSLLEEELALLRGRDDFLQPGVEVAPVYNRLVWNYTRGIDAGEVVYALNYNIQENPDQTPDGIINAADAARMFPQGHGDAYGHYLTGLKGYYSLLMNSQFDWVPRIEAVTVLGQPVSVDYQDERKFAAAAAALARAGKQIFDLTWRKDYQSVRGGGWEHFGQTRSSSERTRHWGLDHWSSRVGQATYLNWIVGNAIVPAIDPDPTHEGIQKIDRTTVPELQELVTVADALQSSADNAEGGLSPLGIAEESIAFDLNPSEVVGADNGTHFEQIYSRTKVALQNALAAFDDAKDVTRLMRSEQDSLAEFQARVAEQELAFENSLVEIYGTPYPEDIGPGKTYKQGYDGPDLIHYSYVEIPELTFGGSIKPQATQTNRVDIQKLPSSWRTDLLNTNFVVSSSDPAYSNGVHYIEFVYGPHGFFGKPSQWASRRHSPGELQQAISDLIKAHDNVRGAFRSAEGAKSAFDRAALAFQANIATREKIRELETGKLLTEQALKLSQFALEIFEMYNDALKETLVFQTATATELVPKSYIAGLAVGGDITSAARFAARVKSAIVLRVLDTAKFSRKFSVKLQALLTDADSRLIDFYGIAPERWNQELRGAITTLGQQFSQVSGSLGTINQRLRELEDAERRYQSLVADGEGIQQEREIFRQRASAVVQGFRTRDAAFRLFRNEKLERYKTLFDLTARYSLLAANAYDYETGLLNTDEGRSFVQRIISSRALGVVRNGQPQYAGSSAGDPGLSSALAEMKADWDVLRGRLGFNNPDAYGTTVSLRTEYFRIVPSAAGSNNWLQILQQARKDDLLEDGDVRRHCMQINTGDGLPVPGILLTFNTTIADGYNLFGHPLAAGDHAFSPSSFATKIFGVGVALEGYRGMDDPSANSGLSTNSPSDPNVWYLDPFALSATPYIYLIPVGVDSMRTPPLGDVSAIRSWGVQDVAIPLPFNIGASDFSDNPRYLSSDTLTEPLFAIRKHQAFRPVSSSSFFSPDLYTGLGTLQRSQYTNNRLVGRSVWNSQWKLVIPARTLLSDPQEGLERFVYTVRDIKVHFVTYSYSGN